MKTILIGLLLISTSVLAQGYGYYPQQQYDQGYYDNYEQQRQLQEEFLDQQFINQQHMLNLQEWAIDKRQRENRERLNPLSEW